LVSALGNARYANLPVNANLTGQLRSRNRPLAIAILSVFMSVTRVDQSKNGAS